MRRIFRSDDRIDFSYRTHYPHIPMFEIDDECLAYESGHELALVEFCSECGEDIRLRKFASLAGLGYAISDRDEAMAYVCKSCELQSLKAKRK